MLPTALLKRLSGEWKSIVLAVVATNAIFLALALLAASIPRQTVKTRILQAFESGSLPLETDRDFKTWMFGNECLILQMLLNPDDDRLRKAIGPRVYYRADDQRQCHLVLALARYGSTAEAPDFFRYTRYWHGHNAAAAALLSLMDISTMRIVLTAIAYGSLVVLAVAGWFAIGRLRILAITTAVTGMAFWALQDFSHSLGNGPADSVLILGFAFLLFRFGRVGSQRGYLSCCATFGAIVTYMEFFTGQLPIAAALLLPFGFFLTRDTIPQEWRLALAGVSAFVLGAAATVAIKQLLAYLVFGAPVLASFAANLHAYTQNLETIGIQGSDSHLKSAIYALGGMVWKWGKVLTYGSDLASRLLFLTTALAWLGAAFLAWRSRSAAQTGAFLPCAAGASIIAAWIGVFPAHSFGHGWFMVRMMLAPIALGWTALIIEAGRQLNFCLAGDVTGSAGNGSECSGIAVA